MCGNFFEGLFGQKPQVAAAAPATAATREKRSAGVVKAAAPIDPLPVGNVAGGGNTNIGISIGTPDSPRKRTTELGL